MRIISGSAKGRRLRSVPGDETRPITDRVKEALFDIIGPDVNESRWWDVFGGTGAVGIEALSRGAAFVRFTEVNRLPFETLKANLRDVGLSARADPQRADAFAMLSSEPDRQFDYVYIAPPQYKSMWSRGVLALDHNVDWLARDGWLIAQIHPKEYERLSVLRLEEFDARKYGTTLLVFYVRREV